MSVPVVPSDHPEYGPNPLRQRFNRAFSSARLSYRAVEKEADAELITRIKTDPVALMNDNPTWPRPHSRKDTERLLEMMEGNLISVIVEKESDEAGQVLGKVPVGLLCMWPTFGHNSPSRVAEFSVDVLPEHRGKGYAEEGLRWLLDWAFDMAGLHRVRLQAFGWNTTGIQLYERIGFERVGVERECVWSSGRYWDLVVLGLLARDWREIREQTAKRVQ